MLVVAGGGIIGLSCAWRLAQRGLSVAVFDRGAMAREASWAAAGMLAPGGEFETAGSLLTQSMRSLSQYPPFLEELRAESGLTIDYRACGAFDVAFSEDEARRLGERAGRQAQLGIVSEMASFKGHEAWFYPGDALVDPRDLTAALLEACRRNGVEFHEGEPITAVEERGNAVLTPAGRYTCDGVLIAAGAWSSDLYQGLTQSFPVRGHLIGWDAHEVSTDLRPILRHASIYVVQRSSGRSIAGSSTEHVSFDRTLDSSVIATLLESAGRLVPDVPQDGVDAWIGFRPGVGGEVPVIGRVHDHNVWTAYGHYRNGVLLAPETARQILELIPSS